MDIITLLDNIISNKSVDNLYISDSEKSEETISFTCYNSKEEEEEIHTFSIDLWNNYLTKVDSKHNLECLKCNRIIHKNEYIKNGTFIYKLGNKIIERANYINGKLDGLYERFYINGIHYEKTYYKDGIYHGTSEFWYDITGKKMKIMNFENGVLNGAYKYWDQNGNLVEDFYYNNGIRSDIFVKLPSKEIVNENSNNNFDYNFEKNSENKEIKIDENMFDLSKKKKKKDKKEKKKDKNDSSDSELEMEKI